MRRIILYLNDILDAMNAIEKFVEDIDFEDFEANDLVSSAVIRKFEIIGEAAGNITEDIRRKYPQVPWKKIVGLRNILIHFYFGVKYDVIWETIKKDIPKLKPLFEIMIKDL